MLRPPLASPVFFFIFLDLYIFCGVWMDDAAAVLIALPACLPAHCNASATARLFALTLAHNVLVAAPGSYLRERDVGVIHYVPLPQ